MATFRAFVFSFAVLLLAAAGIDSPARAQAENENFTAAEIVDAGHRFFGTISGGLATLVERTVANYGLPNGYIIGQEGSGALIGGLRYGDGVLYTKLESPRQVYWQGPSIGWDVGGDGNRTMMLVYHLPNIPTLYKRYFGVTGSAYLIGGVVALIVGLLAAYYYSQAMRLRRRTGQIDL